MKDKIKVKLDNKTKKEVINLLKTRRHEKISERMEILRLISDCYIGGHEFLKGNHLIQYHIESNKRYHARKKRSNYWNFLQPMVDMIVGFIYNNRPVRDGIRDLDYLIKKASKKKDFNAFMEDVAKQSLLYTCGVLVESPKFNPEDVKTKADEMRNDLNPYCVLYRPSQIRDFALDSEGDVDWILLDNTYLDKQSPLEKAKEIKTYTLWTKDIIYTVTFSDNQDGGTLEGIVNELGEVPFVFSGSQDVNEDNITESLFEDVALTSKIIYNTFSLVDEMIASGTFNVLFFPCEDVNDLPRAISASGLQELEVVPYNGKYGSPNFDGTNLGNIAQVLDTIAIYGKSILQKIGFDKESEQLYVQSGIAKTIEFTKTESLLRVLSTQLEQVEKKILYFARKWRNTESNPDDIIVTYNKQFKSEDLEKEHARLMDILTIKIKGLEPHVLKKIISGNFPELDETEIKKIIDDHIKDQVKKETQQTEEINKSKQAERHNNKDREVNLNGMVENIA